MTSGRLTQPGQHDWLAVTLAADQAYEFVLAGLTETAVVQVGALVPSTVVLQNATTASYGAGPQTVFFRPTIAGTYYVDIADPGTTTSGYTVTAQAVSTDYSNNSTTTAVVTVGGAPTRGTLTQSGQDDWLAVSLIANQAYEFTVSGLTPTATVLVGALTPASVASQTAARFLYATGPQAVFFRPTTSGTYYIDVADPVAKTGTYSVGAAAVTTDYANNATTTGIVTVGGAAATGTLTQSGQHDWLAVTLVANQASEFTVRGLSNTAAILVGSLVSTPVATQTAVTFLNSSSTQTVFFRPTASGTYYIDVSDPGTVAGTYNVAAQTVSTDYTDNSTTGGRITIGAAATQGSLTQAGQHDWLAVSLLANQAYEFTVAGLDNTAMVRVGALTPTLVATQNATRFLYGSGPQTVFFRPTTSGTYYVDISDPGAASGTYSAAAEAVSTGYTNNSTTTGVVAVGGAATTGTLTQSGQHDWLAVSLLANQAYEFTVAGLDLAATVLVGALFPTLVASQTAVTFDYTSGPQTVFFRPTTAGTYYIDVSDPSTTTGTYSVTAQAVTTDYTNNTTTTGTITRGASSATVVTADFSGSGRSDIVLQNDNGMMVIENQAALAITGGTVLGNPGADWHVVATADFNGDGQPDVLLQNVDGTIIDYIVVGSVITAGHAFGAPGAGWHVRGTGDFNGDGRADILLQNDNGAVVVWDTDGTSVTGAAYVGNFGAGWTVEGVADFNGDGHPDLLLQNTNGTLVSVLMNGSAVTAEAVLGNPGTGWAVAGSADYNGDGRADILLHSDNGTDVIWETDGTVITGAPLVGNPGASYTAAVTGLDLNGDGSTDLVLQNMDSTLVGFTLNNTAAITAGALLGTPGIGWHAIGNNPTQFIDGTGPAANLTATPGSDMFDLTSFQAGLHVIAGFDPAQDVVHLSASRFASFAAVQAVELAYQGGTYVGLGTGSALVIQGVTPAQLVARNFLLT